ncbi:protein trichome birefringence-like 2 isoform X2 [Magnolia sinica]|uniref:protein trichome birefringence-like 2 isoform X2 n=1 Tax=Magnolia sinica TaxID=86752 RepID=UPI00265B5380|nr:protein trichome birefringence-like 2 isoform X2 [Magnolia sinica]
MDLRKIAIPEQFSSKRRVISGFGVGVLASLLVFTLVLMNNPFKISFLNVTSGTSSPFPWFFPQQAAVISANSSSDSLEFSKRKKEGGIVEKTHEGNLGNEDKNSSFLSFGGGEEGMEKSHEDNSSENFDKGSTFNKEDRVIEKIHVGNLSEKAKNGGNFSEDVEKGSSFSREERVIGKTHEGNSSGNDKNLYLLNSGEGEGVREKIRRGNFSINERIHEAVQGEAKNSSFSNGVPSISEKPHESGVSENDKNSTSERKTHQGDPSEKEKEKIARSYNGFPSAKTVGDVSGKCNIFIGRWVRDEGKPYYPAGSCPHIDKDFDCHGNGRPDDDFLKWRWQPNECNIPSLNASDFLERLRGKRLLFVGDSLNRNMWESLVCILRHSVANKKNVHEISGRKEFKTKGYYSFRYEDYNCSIDFVRSPFLVRPSSVNGQKGEEETLRLDLMDETTPVYREADVLVFNTGHWWTHEKTSKGGGQWNSGGQCHNETEPIFNESYVGSYPSKMRALEHVLQRMKTPVVYLNISRLTDYRKDGHPSIYRKEYKTDRQSQDCSHWCLPGVPDTWNELLYASLVMDS